MKATTHSKKRPYHSESSNSRDSDSLNEPKRIGKNPGDFNESEKKSQITSKPANTKGNQDPLTKNTAIIPEAFSGIIGSEQSRSSRDQFSQSREWSLMGSGNNQELEHLSEMNSFSADQIVHPQKVRTENYQSTSGLSYDLLEAEPLSASRSQFESNSYAASEAYASAYLSNSFLVEMISMNNETISYEFEEEMSPSFVQLYNCRQEQEFFCSPRSCGSGKVLFLKSSGRKGSDKRRRDMPESERKSIAEESREKYSSESHGGCKGEEGESNSPEETQEIRASESEMAEFDDNESKAEAIMSQIEPIEICESGENKTNEKAEANSPKEEMKEKIIHGDLREEPNEKEQINPEPRQSHVEASETLFKKKSKAYEIRKNVLRPRDENISLEARDFVAMGSNKSDQCPRGSQQVWSSGYDSGSLETQSLEMDEESQGHFSSSSCSGSKRERLSLQVFDAPNNRETDANEKPGNQTSGSLTKEESESQKLRRKIEMVQDEQLSNAIESVVYENEDYFSKEIGQPKPEAKEMSQESNSQSKIIDGLEVLNSILRKENEVLRKTAAGQGKQLELYRETFRELKVQAV